MSVNVTNPDLVPLDDGTLAVVLPRPGDVTVALDGDGTAGTTVIGLSEGLTPSTVAVRYGGAADRTDDVDFSADQGVSWGYVPTPGDAASQALITHVRVRPRGAMAKQSSFSISVPCKVR